MVVITDSRYDQSLSIIVEVQLIAQVAIAPIPEVAVGSTIQRPLLMLDPLGRQFSSGDRLVFNFAASVSSSMAR